MFENLEMAMGYKILAFGSWLVALAFGRSWLLDALGFWTKTGSLRGDAS
jgi:hypothetical protein